MPYAQQTNLEGSLQWALYEAQEGDTVDLRELDEEITIDADFIQFKSGTDNITLLGKQDELSGGPLTVINAKETKGGFGGAIFIDAANQVSLINLVIINAYQSGIAVTKSNGFNVQNCYVGVDFNGMNAPNCRTVPTDAHVWSGVNSYDSFSSGERVDAAGITIKDSYGFTINNSVISGNNGFGINISSPELSRPSSYISNCLIGISPDSNAVKGNFAEGINISSSANIYIENSIIAGNGNRSAFLGGDPLGGPQTGAQTSNMRGNGISIYNSQNIEIHGNFIGLSPKNYSKKDSYENYFGNHLNGISINGSRNIIIGSCENGNVIANNGFAFGDVHTSDSNPVSGTYFYGERSGVFIEESGDSVVNLLLEGNSIGINENDELFENGSNAILMFCFLNGYRDVNLGSELCGNSIAYKDYGIQFLGQKIGNTTVRMNRFIGETANKFDFVGGADPSSVKVEDNVITNEEEIISNFSFYPNPVSDFIFFTETKNWMLSSLHGKKYFGTSSNIDLSYFSSGVYILCVESINYRIVKL